MRTEQSGLHRTLRSFGYAAEGLVYLLRTQPNFRVHLLATVAVISLAVVLGATPAEVGVLLLAIGLVLVAEALNSALEALVDLAAPEYHRLAKIAKDTAAAAVLMAAAIAALVGLAVLGPRLLALSMRLTGL
ncbi:MAG: diacylglycerol kinase family protein [Chloroflexi bacterium]|nr:diacylglycerol kinase family protein [Chloroflexota bacterium]